MIFGGRNSSELGLEGFDLSLIGFSDFELKDILADRTEGLTDPDEVKLEPPVEPVTKLLMRCWGGIGWCAGIAPRLRASTPCWTA